MLLWQQWQSEEASGNMNGSRMVDPADPHLSITPLKPGTMYMVTVSVECQRYRLQKATKSITTTTSKFMEHIQSCIYKIALTLSSVNAFTTLDQY